MLRAADKLVKNEGPSPYLPGAYRLLDIHTGKHLRDPGSPALCEAGYSRSARRRINESDLGDAEGTPWRRGHLTEDPTNERKMDKWEKN